MPCPHHDIKIIQRSNHQSAVASAAYQSGERLFSEYDQKQKYYSHKSEIVHTEIMLPPHAPPAYADRNTLWNAAEAIEKQWNSQLARRIVLAIPREIPPEQHADLIRDYCREFFVSKGMIADFAIHDKGNGNPHAHILLTMRAMDENGKWLILLAYAPWVAGTLNTVDYLLICMLPLFCAKLANSIFVDLTSYKNLMISKNKILSVMNELEETGSMEPLHTATHEITFDNVDFAYVPGEPVLKHATFTVPDQKLTAIVGDSGSGKSTILNLIAKYYEATSGTISIGGKPINHIAAERVLEQVSMVDQDVFLFDDTIRDNIRHARPNATDTEIEAACREANCDSFIRKMEKGYDTPTGENGNLLSGGERQRISIARAILKNSPILLLDEATASLDIENELAVKQAIANLLKEKKTVVMIAHTLSIVKNADQILVMGDGRIAESGTHEELLAKGGKYAAMWNAEQKISA